VTQQARLQRAAEAVAREPRDPVTSATFPSSLPCLYRSYMLMQISLSLQHFANVTIPRSIFCSFTIDTWPPLGPNFFNRA